MFYNVTAPGLVTIPLLDQRVRPARMSDEFIGMCVQQSVAALSLE